MIVTATEFKTNIGKYLSLVGTEEVLITKNGRGVAKLVSVHGGSVPALRPLRGMLRGANTTRESIREERLEKYSESVD